VHEVESIFFFFSARSTSNYPFVSLLYLCRVVLVFPLLLGFCGPFWVSAQARSSPKDEMNFPHSFLTNHCELVFFFSPQPAELRSIFASSFLPRVRVKRTTMSSFPSRFALPTPSPSLRMVQTLTFQVCSPPRVLGRSPVFELQGLLEPLFLPTRLRI